MSKCDDKWEALGQALKRARNGCRETQQSLASSLRCSISHVSMCESGDRRPSLEFLVQWADACGVFASDLMKEAGL